MGSEHGWSTTSQGNWFQRNPAPDRYYDSAQCGLVLRPERSTRWHRWISLPVNDSYWRRSRRIVPWIIHSFISLSQSNIFIEPIQINYSEVLVTPARLSRSVLLVRKECKRSWEGAKVKRKAITGRYRGSLGCEALVTSFKVLRLSIWRGKRPSTFSLLTLLPTNSLCSISVLTLKAEI